MSNLDKANALAWSNYWETGFESTFTGHKESDFFIDLNQQWQETFKSLTNGSTVVDLGAGNGALTAKILKTSEEMNMGLIAIAVDYAAVDKLSKLFAGEHHNLTVKANTAIENTELENESVDLCVSQFGFEYANHTKASTEVARILKPGGKLCAIVHHRQSEISQSCASAHMQIGLCHRSKLTAITTKLIRRLRKLEKSHRDPQQDKTAEELRVELNKRGERVTEYGKKLPDQNHINYFLNELTSLFSDKGKKLSFAKKMSVIEAVDDNAKNFQLRMEAMMNASLDQEGIVVLEQALKDAGLRADSSTLVTHQGKVYAWRVEATKPL